jgi:hypothetical protein
MCYFPGINALKMIKQQVPARAGWKLYEVRRLSVKSLQTYEAALRKVCLLVCLAFNVTSAQLGYSCHTVKSYINVKTKARIAMRFLLMNVNNVIN